MPDMQLGARQRPTDPAEFRYSLTRTLPPRAVDLSQPRLLSRWKGHDVRVPIQDQGAMGSCASWASIKAVMMAGTIAGRTDVQMLAAGPLYERVRRQRGWWPDDSGGYIADNLDLLLPGGPAVIEPYRGDPRYDFNDAAWDGQASRDYEGSHRPFYPSEGAFIENVWAALDAGLPVVFGVSWANAWFGPHGGIVDGSVTAADGVGGHAIECWGIVPGYFLCANQWSADWSADAPAFGFDLRPGDFAIPWTVVPHDVIWEARAVSAEPVPAPPTPPTPPTPGTDCKESALTLATGVVNDLARLRDALPQRYTQKRREADMKVQGASAVYQALNGGL